MIQTNLGQVACCNVGIEIYQLWIFMGKYVLLGAIGNYLVSTRRDGFKVKWILRKAEWGNRRKSGF